MNQLMPNIAIYATQESRSKLKAIFQNETFWLNLAYISNPDFHHGDFARLGKPLGLYGVREESRP